MESGRTETPYTTRAPVTHGDTSLLTGLLGKVRKQRWWSVYATGCSNIRVVTVASFSTTLKSDESMSSRDIMMVCHFVIEPGAEELPIFPFLLCFRSMFIYISNVDAIESLQHGF